jgi:hypothetical protein
LVYGSLDLKNLRVEDIKNLSFWKGIKKWLDLLEMSSK